MKIDTCAGDTKIYEAKLRARAEQILKESKMQILDSFSKDLYYSMQYLAKSFAQFFTITHELYLKLEKRIYEIAPIGIITYDYTSGSIRHSDPPIAKSAEWLIMLREAIAEYFVQKGRQKDAIAYYQKCIDDYLSLTQ